MAIAIEKLNNRFEGEFRFRGRTFSVPFVLPGDLVQFQWNRGRRGGGIRVEKIERAESHGDLDRDLTEPFCPRYTLCGGCRAQHFHYESQIRIKTGPIVADMERHFGLTPELLPAPRTAAYRNRMDFVVERDHVGLRGAGDFNAFIDIESCPIQRDGANVALRLFRETLRDWPGLPYNRNDQTGWIKYVTIRQGDGSGVVVLTVARTAPENHPYRLFTEKLGTVLARELPGYSLVECYYENDAQEISCTPGGRALSGSAFFFERLGGIRFRVPYDSFFQPNPEAFDHMIDAALDWLEERESKLPEKGKLLDLYCGAGTLSAIVTFRRPGLFGSVRGFDFVVSSVESAREQFQHFDGALQFEHLDLNKPGDSLRGEEEAGVILLDPPRAGLSPDLRKWIATEAKAPLIVYFSCNPETQIRDLKEMGEHYRPVAALLADAFPQTPHLEQLVLLERK